MPYDDPRELAQDLIKEQFPPVEPNERKSIIDEDLKVRAYGKNLLDKTKSWDFNGVNNDLFFDKTPEGNIAFDKFTKYANGKPLHESQDIVLKVAEELAKQNRFNLSDDEFDLESEIRKYPKYKMNQDQLDSLFGKYVKINPLPYQKGKYGRYLDGSQINDYYSNFLKSIYFDGDSYDFDRIMQSNNKNKNVGLLYALDKAMGWR